MAEAFRTEAMQPFAGQELWAMTRKSNPNIRDKKMDPYTSPTTGCSKPPSQHFWPRLGMSHRGLETAPFPILLCWLPKQFESPFPSWRALHLTRLAPQHLSRIFCGQIYRCTPITTTSAKYRHEKWFRFNKNPNSKKLVRNTNYTSQTIIWEYNWICMYIIYIYIYVCVCSISIPVVPHKAVAEVSNIRNYRRGELLWCMDGTAIPLMDWKVVGVLAVYLSVYPSFQLSVYLSPTDPFICLSCFLSIHLFSCLSLCVSSCVTGFLFFLFSLCVCLVSIWCPSIYLLCLASGYLPICLCIDPFFYLSIHLCFLKSLWHACVKRKNVGYQQGNWFEGVNVGFQHDPFCTLGCPKSCPFFTHSYDWNFKIGTGPRFWFGAPLFQTSKVRRSVSLLQQMTGLHVWSCQHQKRNNSAKTFLRDLLQKYKTMSAVVTTSYQCVLRFFHPISLKYCACHEKVRPGHTTCCACHAKYS